MIMRKARSLSRKFIFIIKIDKVRKDSSILQEILHNAFQGFLVLC